MCGVAWAYESGSGVATDVGEALTWYRRAADALDPDAMDALARMYEFGRGVAKDAAVADDWRTKAAAARKASKF